MRKQAVNWVYHPLQLPNPLVGVIDISPLSPGRPPNIVTPLNFAIQVSGEKIYDAFCYFDNDEKGYAAQNALSLQNIFKE